MYNIALMVLWHWIYTVALYIHTVHCGILHLDHTGSSKQHFQRATPPLKSPVCDGTPDKAVRK